jgi:hypothetical protein
MNLILRNRPNRPRSLAKGAGRADSKLLKEHRRAVLLPSIRDRAGSKNNPNLRTTRGQAEPPSVGRFSQKINYISSK